MENFTRGTSKAHYSINNSNRLNCELDFQQIALHNYSTHGFLSCCSFSHTHFFSFCFDSIRFTSFHFAWHDGLVTNENRMNWQWPQTKIKTWTIKAKTEKKQHQQFARSPCLPLLHTHTHACEYSNSCVILFLDWPYIDGIGLFRFNDETNLLLLLLSPLLLLLLLFFYSIYELSVTIHSPDYFSQN